MADDEDYLDKRLMADFLDGSARGFQEVYNRFFEKLYFFCFKLIRNREEAKDITITVLHASFEKHRQLTDIRHLKNFLYVSVRNKSLNFLRNSQARHLAFQKLSATLSEETADFTSDELDAELASAILMLVGKLPDRSREVVELYYLEGYRYKEIAARLGISLKTVENQLRYALDKLRAAIAAHPGTGILLLAAWLACKYLALYILLALQLLLRDK